MLVNLHESNARENYQALTGAVFPRPLLWVLTENEEGQANIAPYSFVNIVSTEPPLISIAFGYKTGQKKRGTLHALMEKGKATLHLTTKQHIKEIEESGKEGSFILASEKITSEVEGYPPRVKSCPIALFCEFYDIIEIKKANTLLLICKINHIYKEGDVSANALHPLACVGEKGIQSL